GQPPGGQAPCAPCGRDEGPDREPAGAPPGACGSRPRLPRLRPRRRGGSRPGTGRAWAQEACGPVRSTSSTVTSTLTTFMPVIETTASLTAFCAAAATLGTSTP